MLCCALLHLDLASALSLYVSMAEQASMLLCCGGCVWNVEISRLCGKVGALLSLVAIWCMVLYAGLLLDRTAVGCTDCRKGQASPVSKRCRGREWRI
jgi:hypothetical protein